MIFRTVTNKRFSIISRWVVVSSVLFVVSAALATSQRMSGAEKTVFFWFYNLPLALERIFALLTYLGSVWTVGIVCAVLLLIKQWRLLTQVVIAGITTYAFTEAIKTLIARPRPFILLTGVSSRGPIEQGFGYPSGHTAVATAIGCLLVLAIPKKYRFFIPLWIIVVAISRLYLGVHAPLDIIGGFAIGMLAAWAPLALVTFYEHRKQPKKVKAIVNKSA